MNKHLLKYIAVLLLFGSNGIVASYVILNSYEIVYFRTMIASIFLIFVLIISRHKFTWMRFKKDFFYLSLAGIGLGTSWLFLFEAYAKIGVSIATLLYYCGPVIVMVVAPFIFKEKHTSVKIVGFVMVLAGMTLLNSEAFLEGEMSIGIIYGLLAAVMYAVMVIFNKKAKHIQGTENSAIQLIAAFLIVAIYTASKQGFAIELGTTNLYPILILGIVNTGLGCLIYFTAMSKLPVQTVSVLGYLEPLSALLFSVLFLNEQLSMMQLVGATFILGGAAFAELYRPKRHVLLKTP